MFSPKYSEVYPVNTVEQALTLRAVSELDVTRTITSLKPSRAKDIFGIYFEHDGAAHGCFGLLLLGTFSVFVCLSCLKQRFSDQLH